MSTNFFVSMLKNPQNFSTLPNFLCITFFDAFSKLACLWHVPASSRSRTLRHTNLHLLQAHSSVDFVLFAPVHTCCSVAVATVLLLYTVLDAVRKTKPPVTVRGWWDECVENRNFRATV